MTREGKRRREEINKGGIFRGRKKIEWKRRREGGRGLRLKGEIQGSEDESEHEEEQ